MEKRASRRSSRILAYLPNLAHKFSSSHRPSERASVVSKRLRLSKSVEHPRTLKDRAVELSFLIACIWGSHPDHASLNMHFYDPVIPDAESVQLLLSNWKQCMRAQRRIRTKLITPFFLQVLVSQLQTRVHIVPSQYMVFCYFSSIFSYHSHCPLQHTPGTTFRFLLSMDN